MKNQKICIIGYGRFGRLLAEILKGFGQVFVLTSRESIEASLVKMTDYSELDQMDLVIPAVPISAFRKVLSQMTEHLKKGTVVMDVCSVKVLPVQWMKEVLPANVQILASHPMFGPDSAKNGLNGLQMVFCPIRIDDERYADFKKYFANLDLQVIEETPQNHDRQAARSLSLVHFIGRGLGRMGVGNQPITTLGFERLLKVNETVKNDTWQLFLDMQKFNPYAREVRAEFVESLKELEEEIDD